MNGKYLRTTILAALALAGGAQAGTNAVHSLDPLTDLFLKPEKRHYAHTGGVPLPAK